MHTNKTSLLPIAIAILLSLAFSAHARAPAVPRYKVDPSWPKQLPNNWIMGIPTGIFIDLKEFLIHPKTVGQGSVWSSAFSPDPKQMYLYVADGDNGVIRVLNRQTGAEVTHHRPQGPVRRRI